MGSRVAVVGAGAMGEAIVSGMLAHGWRPADLVLAVRREEHAAALRASYGVEVTDALSAAAEADVVLVGVKPYDVAGVLAQIGPRLRPGTLVASLAVGITTTALEAALPEGTPVVRVVPNTPSQVGAGVAVISAGTHCDDAQLAVVDEIMSAVGIVVRVPERLQDAAGAISGSGPAYAFLVIEALVEAGVHLGLPRATATDLAVQTFVGASRLAAETGEHPAVLRERVTSPGGTTAAALSELEERGLRAAFIAATRAARDRSREIGD
ncbi:pyrroline-5-carboxylate reductase [Mumia sp. zg.B21]|uniref:pyrroline-5-carboxylate reductase n=1 Tax=Mumia sp. zg.B21 TaxID=2855447 RepID=UPI001C6E7695|nr:pyrroline-5-carboxylate reductase [Mumia sp. zg.B21]MBW9209471.1 pyrroline-5-carboxylate reductase [Mumia sp. zg.B21]